MKFRDLSLILWEQVSFDNDKTVIITDKTGEIVLM